MIWKPVLQFDPLQYRVGTVRGTMAVIMFKTEQIFDLVALMIDLDLCETVDIF